MTDRESAARQAAQADYADALAQIALPVRPAPRNRPIPTGAP